MQLALVVEALLPLGDQRFAAHRTETVVAHVGIGAVRRCAECVRRWTNARSDLRVLCGAIGGNG